MRIALLLYDVSLTGGAERVAINLASEICKYHEVTLISVFNEKKYSSPSFNTVTILDTNCSITRRFAKISKRIRDVLKEKSIDIVIAISAGVVTLALAGSLGLSTRVVYAEHSNLENKTYGLKHQLRQRIGARLSDKVVVLTERDCNNFCSTYGTKNEKVIVIPNWYEGGVAKTSEYNLESKKIISVGRLEYVKGYDYLVEVASKLKERHSDWVWDIYGDGSLRQELSKEIAHRGLEDFVFLRGTVNNLSDLYSEYAFLVMTSRYEGLPMALLEAKASGLPIVSFDCPTGPSEIVADGINGFIVDVGDVDKMCVAIDELISNKGKRELFSNNARIGLELYEKERVLGEWLSLFNQLNVNREYAK